jgi:serine phosphatase RsbU (regulator of sigma subunit)/pSer/pThr/pTyr-binding forkhead associated (FHA) protein
MDYLEIIDGHGERRFIPLDRPHLLVGREPGCDICLNHPNVSRRHAQFQRTDQGRWLLQDLNSLNHTYLGKEPVQQLVLQPDQSVRIAEYFLTLREKIDPKDSKGGGTTSEDSSSPSWPGLEAGWLDRLQDFQRGLLHLDEPRQVLERLAQEFTVIAQPREVAVGRVTPEGYVWEVVLGGRKEAPSATDLKTRMETDDSNVQVWSEDAAARAPTQPLSLLFPMKGRTGVIGHVFVKQPRGGPMPPALQRYLGLFATTAGLVWDNLQLAALRLTQKAIEQEMLRAREIQIGLFPPTFEVDERLNAFAVNLPSVRVSGDYYDLFRTGPDTVAFVIADAMGHGIPAALMMAAVRATVRMGLKLALPWEALFRGLDDVIIQSQGSTFVTGLAGQIDLARNELLLVSAGHDPPSILVDGKPVLPPAHCQTRPWGLDFDSEWQVGRIPLGRGDWSILCFTDGVYHTGVHPRYGFGTRCVAAYHQENCRQSAEDLCQGLLGSLAPPERAALMDDQTVLVLRSARR